MCDYSNDLICKAVTSRYETRALAGAMGLVMTLAGASTAGAQPEEPPAGEPVDRQDEPRPEEPLPEPTEEPRVEPEPTPDPGPKRGPDPKQKQEPELAPATREAAAGGAVADASGEDWKGKLVLEVGPVYVAPVVLLSTYLTPYVGSDAFYQAGDIAERPGFRLRHARFGLDAGYTDQARLRVSTELAGVAAGSSARIHDAWAAYTPFPFFGIHAGAHTVPFSRNRLLPSGHGALIERPLTSRAMAPGNQVGATLQGDVAQGAFGYAAGVFNGLQRDGQFYEGYAENYAPFGNRFDGVVAAMRVTTSPLGHLANTAADERHGPFRFGVGANYLFSDGGARDLHGAGGDAHLQVSGFHLLAEGLWLLSLPEDEPTQPTTAVEKVTSYGVSAEAGYVIVPRMFGLAARFEWIDPDLNSDDESDNWLLGGGAFLSFLDDLFKLAADYTHRHERFGLALKNDAVTISLQAELDPAETRVRPSVVSP